MEERPGTAGLTIPPTQTEFTHPLGRFLDPPWSYYLHIVPLVGGMSLKTKLPAVCTRNIARSQRTI